MRFNSDALKIWSEQSVPARDGYLAYKSLKEDYRQRWFRLCGNMLFYYKSNSDLSEPIGLLVLEQCEAMIEPPSELPFVFSLKFFSEPGKKHYFSGRSEQYCRDWITAIKNSSYAKICGEVLTLYQELSAKAQQQNFSIKQVQDKLPPSIVRSINKGTNTGNVISSTANISQTRHDPFNVASKHQISRPRTDKSSGSSRDVAKTKPTDDLMQTLNTSGELVKQSGAAGSSQSSNVDLLHQLLAPAGTSGCTTFQPLVEDNSRPANVFLPQTGIHPVQRAIAPPRFQTPNLPPRNNLYRASPGSMQPMFPPNRTPQPNTGFQHQASPRSNIPTLQPPAKPGAATAKPKSTFYKNWETFE